MPINKDSNALHLMQWARALTIVSKSRSLEIRIYRKNGAYNDRMIRVGIIGNLPCLGLEKVMVLDFTIPISIDASVTSTLREELKPLGKESPWKFGSLTPEQIIFLEENYLDLSVMLGEIPEEGVPTMKEVVYV